MDSESPQAWLRDQQQQMDRSSRSPLGSSAPFSLPAPTHTGPVPEDGESRDGKADDAPTAVPTATKRLSGFGTIFSVAALAPGLPPSTPDQQPPKSVSPPLASTSAAAEGPSSVTAAPGRSAVSTHQSLSSPCFVHSHLDHSLGSASASLSPPPSARVQLKHRTTELAQQVRDRIEVDQEVVLVDGDGEGGEGEEEGEDGEGEEGRSLTRQLAETAVSVRQMSKQLGRARVVSHIQSVLIITKARDNHLIRLTRELALFLMETSRNGRDRGLIVYVDSQLRKSKRFDAEGMERSNPNLFRPLQRRYSRTSSSASLATTGPNGSGSNETPLKRMTPLSQLNDAMRRSGESGSSYRREPSWNNSTASLNYQTDEGQLRYWTNEMCSKSPHLFDFVITVSDVVGEGDGTVLYASWLFQHVVPPIIPFALGSLGFLTNFDFSNYAYTLNHAIDHGIRVNLRMRFTCTVYRAIEDETCKQRRAVRSGRTGGIYMSNLSKDGWEAIESGGVDQARERINRADKGGKKTRDKEIKCFVTRPAESFEVLNDLVVDRGPSPYVSLLELFGDEHHMTTVQADGLTVSTPTGSTAYSLSAGGSLVHPEIPALLITPICPHTLSFRPMLLPDSMELRICVPYNSRSTAWASFDGRGRVELRQGDHIKVTASQYPFPTVCAENQSTDWFQAISRTLKWNERERQKSFVVVEESRKKASADASEKAASTARAARNAVTEKARANFGDEEDEVDEEEEDDDEEDEEEDEVDAMEEEFDIDDRSSENQTTSSSPNVMATDPTSTIPALSSSQRPRPASREREHSTASSVAELRDDYTERFKDPAPRPPKLSARHSFNQVPSAKGPSGSASPTGAQGLTMATTRCRERGEEGDRDHLRESLSVKRNIGGQAARRFGASSSLLSPTSQCAEKTSSKGGDEDEDSSRMERAFAVVGVDSDTSAYDC
ncbi:BZ3500_MvSof-1268-A1-R1_Chr2-1g04652 [Microbotryum saponariae]|uniref:BZ3500_MvSof-1268-A1-R1_Chr2-1g04652 protein n=1 Tax=Microbotryum saponariae TaxID=289078 RepID=A0A2X0KFH5_9BASI|nr:BZ3500_MvSof-1268-A1-R1_Chr2-1g04652 [Microbotryum saponariae]SCZ92222.1 BZ3501_MvSof-1269-A2-R1_Chr2-1g04308 [Microbotryum saponariae]